MKLALIGYGSVAKALEPLLQADGRFEIAGIHTRSRPAADSAEAFLDAAKAQILVELTTLNPWTGEPAVSHIRAAFARGMHVVTANKGPVAHAYRELADEAERRGLIWRFESSVMDGTPIFNQFRNNLPGVTVLGFAGVLNSTSNLAIEAMEHGESFEDGLNYARELGVAEADASFDIDGWDSAAKTAALANVLMDARTHPQNVDRSGIAGYTPAMLQDLGKQGLTVRLVSRARVGGLLSAKAEVLPRTSLLASAPGTSNVILFETDRMGTLGTMSINPGVEQTAYGVYVDLLDIAAQC
jgi:homoserine dehydrogenase